MFLLVQEGNRKRKNPDSLSNNVKKNCRNCSVCSGDNNNNDYNDTFIFRLNMFLKTTLVCSLIITLITMRPTPVWAGTRPVSMLARALYEYSAIFHLGTVVQDLLPTSLQLPEKALTSLVGTFSPWTQGISWDLANRAGPGPANGVGTRLSGEILLSLDSGDQLGPRTCTLVIVSN